MWRKAIRTFPIDALLLIAAVLLTLAPRAYGIYAPLVEFHSWRQTHTAMVARNFLATGYNIFNPQVDQFGPQPTFVESEFPLYQFAVAMIYAFTGAQDWVARGVAIAFACGSVVVLFFLVRNLMGRLAALLACVFFALSPFGIFFGRAVMPESAMLFLSLLSLYLVCKWQQNGKSSAYLGAIVSSALAIAVKLPIAHIIIPALCLILAQRGRGALREVRTYVFLAGAMLPPAAWYLYAAEMGRNSGVSLGLVSTVGGNRLGSLDLLLSPDFYQLLGRWLVSDVTTWVGLPFVGLGLTLAICQAVLTRDLLAMRPVGLAVASGARFLSAWAMAVFLYFLAAANGLVNQEYYILPAVPVASALGGTGLAFIYRGGAELLRWRSAQMPAISSPALRPYNWAFGLFVLTAFVSFAIFSFDRIAPLYNQITPYLDAGQLARAVTPRNAALIAVHHGEPEVLYYASRRGWHVLPEEFSLSRIESLRAKGATAAVIAEAVPLAGSQQMAEVLRVYPTLATSPSLLVIDLTRGQGQRKLARDASFNFGHSMQLTSYEAVVRQGVSPESIDVVLRWKALEPMAQDYHISLRLFAPNGKLAAQVDGVPVNWFFPTTRWQAGDIIEDPYQLSLTSDSESSQLRLELVVYDGATVQPLAVDETGQPYLDLGPVSSEVR